MKPRWFAHPVLSVLIGATWELLQQSAAPAQLITATVLGLVLPRVLHGFLPEPVRPRAWGTALRLLGVVLWDGTDRWLLNLRPLRLELFKISIRICSEHSVATLVTMVMAHELVEMPLIAELTTRQPLRRF
jgi:multisubunit Na+/H+ antiporter MnhE subunit